MKDNFVEELTSKTKEKLNGIPHRLEKGKQRDRKQDQQDYIKGLEEDVEQLILTSNRWLKKYNKKQKDLENERVENKKLKEEIHDLNVDKNKLLKDTKQLNYKVNKATENEESIEKELTDIKQQLLIYKQKERKEIEQGIHVETLQKEFEAYKAEAEEKIRSLKGELAVQKRRNKNIVKSVNGEKRSKRRKDTEIEKLIEEIKERDKSIEKHKEGKAVLRNTIENYKKRIKELTEKESQQSLEEVVKAIEYDTEKLNEQDLNTLEKMYQTYKSLLQKKEREDQILEVKNGYIVKDKEPFFISLDNQKPIKVTNPKHLILKDGDVCRVYILKGGIAEVDIIHKDNDYKTFTLEEKLKLKEVQKAGRDKKKIHPQFLDKVHDKNVVVITAKGVQSYQSYLGKYRNAVVFINPYDMGLKQIYNLIDKADIVVARTDAVPHSVSDYLKENWKEKTSLGYKLSSKALAGIIYNQADKLSDKEFQQKAQI